MGYTPPVASATKLRIYIELITSPVAWTEIKSTNTPAAPYYVVNGTIHYSRSLTNFPTLNFTVYSDDHGFIPVVGTPIKMTHDDFGDVFGGKIVQARTSNIPGHPRQGVTCEVQCTSWEMVLNSRLLYLAGMSVYPGVTLSWTAEADQRSFHIGYASGSPDPNAQYITSILWIKVNGGPEETFGEFGDNTKQWNWGLGYAVINTINRATLNAGDVLEVRCMLVASDAVYVPPSYSQTSAGDIATALVGLLSSEGFTIVVDDPGPIVDTISFTLQDTVASALDSLCSYISTVNAGYRYYIVAGTKVVHFEKTGSTRSAPYDFLASDGSDGNALIQVSNQITQEKYVNAAVVNISNALGSLAVKSYFNADGTKQTFDTTYPIGQAPTITYYPNMVTQENPEPQTVGLKGQTGFQWYYEQNSKTIEQGEGGDDLVIDGSDSTWVYSPTHAFVAGPGTKFNILAGSGPGFIVGAYTVVTVTDGRLKLNASAGAVGSVGGLWNSPIGVPSGLIVEYVPIGPQVQVYIDTTEVAARRAIEGGSGEHDTFMDVGSSMPFVVLTSTNLAKTIVDSSKSLSEEVQIVTYRGGAGGTCFDSGQSIALNLPDIGATGDYVIDKVEITDEDKLARWQITCLTGAIIGDWKRAAKTWGGGAGSSYSGSFGSGGGAPTTGFYEVPGVTM